ncbi:MAG: PQQ-dependent sugar dehydrogenase [Planctomycetes bacterium]|nr:PQQ-dependent sugar dehydrogenase [Planctomycetota bacterium]
MRLVPVLSMAAVGLAALPLSAQNTPLTTELVASGFARPVAVLASPIPGDDRMFVVEQNQSDIHILHGDGSISLFLDLTGLTVTTGNEQGLLGMAFHPDYANNGYFYVDYTRTGGNTRIERYTVSGDPDVADAGSGFTILNVTQPQTNHNAGNLAFGPDGMLWIGFGDGGNANDTGSGHVAGGNAQSGTTLLGKMIRIDVDGGSPYAIPADNPYVGDPTVLDEIWAFGLRNPWRYAFDSETGDLWIGDVGQNAREEVDFLSAATIAAVNAGTASPINFGWRCMEGLNCTTLSGCTCNDPSLTLPVKDYVNPGLGRAVIGGVPYRGEAIPDLAGQLIYADNSSNKYWVIAYDGSTVTRDEDVTPLKQAGGGLVANSPSSFGVDQDGETYICDLNGGEIFKIKPGGPFVGLGHGLAGAHGKPILFGTGGVGVGEAGAIHLRNAVENAPLAVLFLSVAEGAANFKGGTLVTIPLLASFNLFTDASGGLDIPWADLGLSPGQTVVFQYGIQDAAAVFGVSLSNGLIATAP